MIVEQTARAKALVAGALAADAAALGLHWIYDQDRIASITGPDCTFRKPVAADYEGVPAFFAHPTRVPGDPSQYGEQLLVMLRCLTEHAGAYDSAAYAAAFRAHFGYGGAYVGYIDHATRDTLDNFRRAEDAAQASAAALPFNGPDSVTSALASKALALRPKLSGAALRRAFEEAVRVTHDDDAIVAHGFAVLDAILAGPPPTGAKDVQMPAIAKLPPLVAKLAGAEEATFTEAVASAVRTTSDHPTAAAFGMLCARMMQAAVVEGTLEAVIEAARTHGTAETTPLIEDALARRSEDALSVTRHFGMACDLAYGVPSALHNIATADGYQAAVRANIMAGGDSCGRAILVGAVMGALDAVPAAWKAKLTHQAELDAQLSTLLDV